MVYCICGGDMRMAELANHAALEGQEVRVFGFDTAAYFTGGVALYDSPADCVSGCERVILPLPVTRDGVHLFAPFSGRSFLLPDIWPLIEPGALVCGGKISAGLRTDAEASGIVLHDYLAREEFAVANAVPTAEGAVQLAMEQLKSTLAGTPCLILGYGRIGMVLARLLRGMNVPVTVSCRKPGALALAKAMGCAAVPLAALSEELPRFSLLFNTGPARILTPPLLGRIPKDALLIDLASSPGGADPACCRKLGLKLLIAQALPGKVAPVTGGRIIYDTVAAVAADCQTRKEGV